MFTFRHPKQMFMWLNAKSKLLCERRSRAKGYNGREMSRAEIQTDTNFNINNSSNFLYLYMGLSTGHRFGLCSHSMCVFSRCLCISILLLKNMYGFARIERGWCPAMMAPKPSHIHTHARTYIKTLMWGGYTHSRCQTAKMDTLTAKNTKHRLL